MTTKSWGEVAAENAADDEGLTPLGMVAVRNDVEAKAWLTLVAAAMHRVDETEAMREADRVFEGLRKRRRSA